MDALALLLILPPLYAVGCYLVYWIVRLVSYGASPRVRKTAVVIATYPGVVGNTYSAFPMPFAGWALSVFFPNANFVWIPLPLVFPADSVIETVVFLTAALVVIGVWYWLIKRWLKEIGKPATDS